MYLHVVKKKKERRIFSNSKYTAFNHNLSVVFGQELLHGLSQESLHDLDKVIVESLSACQWQHRQRHPSNGTQTKQMPRQRPTLPRYRRCYISCQPLPLSIGL